MSDSAAAAGSSSEDVYKVSYGAGGSSSEDVYKMSVILVDSDAELTETHRTLLEDKFNMDVKTAVTRKEIIAAYREGKSYDILFIDLNLPILDGIEVTKNLRKMEVKTKIVGLHDDNDEFDDDDVEDFIKAGLDVCVKKPLNEEKVRLIIQNTKTE